MIDKNILRKKYRNVRSNIRNKSQKEENIRKKVIDYYIKLTGSNYAYCNGYYRTKWSKGTVNAPNMVSSCHLDTLV